MKRHGSEVGSATETVEAQEAGGGRLYIGFELGEKHWKLAFTDGPPRVRHVTVPSRALERLKAEIASAKERLNVAQGCQVSSCYEAGRDGFWLHRFLESIGVENIIVDSASIEVSRRKRRPKTDRIDAQKLAFMLIRYHGGEPKVWSVLRVPESDDEGARHLHREREQLKKEVLQHRMRMSSLLVTQGVSLEIGKDFLEQLGDIRLWDGTELAPELVTRLKREHHRLCEANKQLREIEAERRRLVKESASERMTKVRELQSLCGVGINGAWILVMEFFGWRRFDNRKEVGGAAGLVGTPHDSGVGGHEQGISKAGNRYVRWIMVELAWCWLRFQPESALSRWFEERFAHGNSRQRRTGIVALARRLLVDLWRFVEKGVVPEGAKLKATSGASATRRREATQP